MENIVKVKTEIEKPLNIVRLSSDILDFLLEKRGKDTSIKFYLRQRNTNNRLNNGYWFQGNSNYAFIGMYNRSGGTNKTKSVGFVIAKEKKNNNIHKYIEIVFNEEKDERVIHFYKECVKRIGGFKKINQTKYHRYYKKDRDVYECLEEFITIHKVTMDGVMREMELTDILEIDEDIFQKSLRKIIEIRKKKRNIETKIEDHLDSNSENFMDTSVELNTILYGPPGTGKTYNTINEALKIIDADFYDRNEDNRSELKKKFNELLISDWNNSKGQIAFCTFHQSMCYEDFVEGIKPKTVDEKVLYEIEDGIFKRICNRAKYVSGNLNEVIENFKKEINEHDGKAPIEIIAKGTTFDVIYRGNSVFYVQPRASIKDKPWYPVNINNIFKAFETGEYSNVYNPTYIREILKFLKENRGLKKGMNVDAEDKQYVLVIDEINRGNVSQIFGELITLIENDKRAGADEELEVILPYSKETFAVPKNVHIIGTMNTADRSVESLDTALRRRFSFVEMPPRPFLINEVGVGVVEDIDLVNLLETINKRIEILLDKDHMIGHSYFIAVKTIDDLMNVFTNKIVPLLQEYFFGDYGKIGLVLGSGFVNKNVKVTDDVFADFDYQDTDILIEKEMYSLVDLGETEPVDFKNAIDLLLNGK